MEAICLDNGLISKGEHGYNLAGKLVTEAATFAPAPGWFKFIALVKWLKASPPVILKACLKRKTNKRS